MNDKIITKIITKTHFSLLAFFLFIFLTGFFIFVALLEGFTISHLKLGDIKFEQLYLKWDNRLIIKASVIDLNALYRDNEPITLKPLSKITNSVHWMERWISSIDIQAIRYQDTKVSLHYAKGSIGTLGVFIGPKQLAGNFTLTPRLLKIALSSKIGSPENIKGDISLYLQQQKLNGSVQLKLPNTPTLRGYAEGDQKNIDVNIKADQPFSSLNTIVDFLEVDPQIRPWITENLKGSRLTLHECHGSFLYDQPQKLLQSLIFRASVDDAQYTFAPTIAPIIAKRVDLLFKNGVLDISPQNGHFYTMPTEKSHLSIDFNPLHIQLNAHILTGHAQLNDSILNLLHYYEITVPIRQNSGLCSVDLGLFIDLDNFKTTAKGKFIAGNSELQLENFLFQTMGGIVTLDNTKISFEGFDTNYKNKLHAKIEGNYDAHSENGRVQIFPHSCTPTGDATVLALSTLSANAMAVYHIDPLHDSLQILPSLWKVFGETINIEGFTVPFDFKKASAVIPKLHYSVPNKIEGTLEGEISLEKWWLQLNLEKFNASDLLLRNKNYPLILTGDKNTLKVTSTTASYWQLHGQNFSLSPFTLKAIGDKVVFDTIKTKIDTVIEGSVSGEYLLKHDKGSILLNDITPLNPDITGYINLNKTQKFTFDTAGEHLTLHSDSLGIDFTTIAQGWKIMVPDISLLSINSPLLRHYQITHGYANLFYNPIEHQYTFNGIIEYPFHLMMVNDDSLSSYRFSGSYQNGKTLISVNDRLQIEYAESIKVRADNMGINAPELARWLDIANTDNETKEGGTPSTNIHLDATNTYLYLMKNRKVMADTLSASLTKGELEARMSYAQGWADLLMKNGIYYVKGNHFNDIFMEHLFAFSDFKGGEMSFELAGKADDFEGIMRIENATLKEYKLLNNVLSFINTVPSLATFSIPNYNTRGLPLKEAYSHYTYRNHQFNVDNFTLNSPELKMVGEGKMNFKEDSIQGTLTLKSDLGSKLGRVPVVGYILFGDDGSVSTTVAIKGKLSDPVVETSITKEIITAPFNILKRTITYPFLWMMDNPKKKQ